MQPLAATTEPKALIDSFGRRITYVRLSVSGRCDLRRRYCMAQTMAFPPSGDILSLEQIALPADLFIARGGRRGARRADGGEAARARLFGSKRLCRRSRGT